jgi:hypothetical protein
VKLQPSLGSLIRESVNYYNEALEVRMELILIVGAAIIATLFCMALWAALRRMP